MQEEVIVVVAGGGAVAPECVPDVPAGAHVFAADGGLAQARMLGLDVAAVIGDLDSVALDELEEASAHGARIEPYPEEKDATDLELALDSAHGLHPRRVLVLAGAAGRLDHLLSALLLLGSLRYDNLELDAVVGSARLQVIRGERTLEGEPGELVSLLPLHGPAEGVRTEGLVYPLRGETLAAGTSRGISNVFAEKRARVKLERGVLLAIRPGAGELQERGGSPK